MCKYGPMSFAVNKNKVPTLGRIIGIWSNSIRIREGYNIQTRSKRLRGLGSNLLTATYTF
jgi:hypothetical protein